MRHLISLLLLINFYTNGNAQSNSAFFLGPGIGFDHGGIGIKGEYQPVKYIGIFAGAGYNLAALGANAGLIYNISPDKRITPVITAMYGYNAVLSVQYQNRTDREAYYGLTVGAGLDFKLGQSRRNKINVNLLVPLRSASFFRDYNNVRRNGTITQEIIPIGISFGWHFLIANDQNK